MYAHIELDLFNILADHCGTH